MISPTELWAQPSWSVHLPSIGTFSSPRTTDLNGDGVKDIILGAGAAELTPSDSAIIALDGASGEMLWRVAARDQVFGSAALKDIDGDGVEDVVIGGRSAVLKAISGASGKVLWEFFPAAKLKEVRKAKWYNFYNPQFIPDQDQDGLEDLLVSNGGDVLVEAYDPNRPAGYLMVLSARTGEVLAKAAMPDDKEIYMSVVAIPSSTENELTVVFGTGGETIGGNLYATTLSDIMHGDLSGAKLLSSSPNKGFIAPPVAVDLTGDTVPDIVAISVAGDVIAFDGSTFKTLWQTTLPNTEAYSSLAVGNFTSDTIPDLFASVAQGEWPNLEWNRQFMVNGSNGAIEFRDSLGFYQTSTAVAIDLTEDGRDEIIMSVNYQQVNELYQKFFYNMLVAIDIGSGDVQQLGETWEGSNISSTPWIGDLDGNGMLDIIYCHGTDLRHTYTFSEMQIHRIATELPIKKPISWGAYMGSYCNGLFQK
ncbi:MAG: PQQ-binding-like beta-propeller repeat protein [Tunicatimonas sp.]|uniref:outer membrane protein assembly factor BamB family protein n=1 Tax=Tunicatimonas sp. TaxID=1940096 RepID=UPI003C707140